MNSSQEFKNRPRRSHGMMGGRGMHSGEKPKDLKKSLGKLMRYIGSYKVSIVLVMIFAACSTVFNVAGPKVLGKATTVLTQGLMNKIQGLGGIDFTKISKILFFTYKLFFLNYFFSDFFFYFRLFLFKK